MCNGRKCKRMSRVQKLFDEVKLADKQAVLLTKPSNIFYISGFTGEGCLLLTKGLQAIITDFRYTEQAERQAPGFSVHMIGNGVSHMDLAYGLMKDEGIGSLLYEDDEFTVRSFEKTKSVMEGIAFESIRNAPEKVREVKDDGEIALIEEACDISCRAFDWLLGELKPGMTEIEARLKLDFKMLELGGDGLAFDTIVAGGENGSLPHAIPGQRKFQLGDMITFDFGAKKGGYCADMTRTVALGQPKDEMRRIYDIVLQAQETCEALLAPGKNCREVDRVARDIIDNAGYKGRFGHGLGHAVGIDIHESPRLSPACDATLVTGHTMTVEPGIYVPGLGGVRIENTCVITADGGRTLVHAPKDLVIL
ncbi:MAG: hypothetical protein CW338_02315 [Clostridiales bacterium]|nr:hypothetical protein [Clostridiales bacterium]